LGGGTSAVCTVIEMEAGFYWASDASYLYIYISLCEREWSVFA